MELKRSVRAAREASEQTKPAGQSSSVAQYAMTGGGASGGAGGDGGDGHVGGFMSERAKCMVVPMVRLAAPAVVPSHSARLAKHEGVVPGKKKYGSRGASENSNSESPGPRRTAPMPTEMGARLRRLAHGPSTAVGCQIR